MLESVFYSMSNTLFQTIPFMAMCDDALSNFDPRMRDINTKSAYIHKKINTI